jgi:phosphoglycerate dehydrogenase-like enzyme
LSIVPKLTILDDYQQVALASADWSAVQDRFEIEVVSEYVADLDEVRQRLAGSRVVVLMRERTPMPDRLISALPELQLIVTTGMVNAAVDLDAARRRGITVCGTSGTGNAVPELTIGMMIALARNFVAEDAAVRSGGWQHTVGMGLAGRTLGVIGLGRLGRPVAALAQALQMDVIAWSPHLTPERAEPFGVRAVNRAELFSGADVITIHMPLSPASRGLITADDLALMKPSAYLINTSRGPIVDEDALADALRRGAIAGAGLDVYSVEPLPPDDPIRSLPRTLLLPHIGYVTDDNYAQWYAQIVEDVLAWADGSPVRVL